jgi:hypothetical protein
VRGALHDDGVGVGQAQPHEDPQTDRQDGGIDLSDDPVLGIGELTGVDQRSGPALASRAGLQMRLDRCLQTEVEAAGRVLSPSTTVARTISCSSGDIPCSACPTSLCSTATSNSSSALLTSRVRASRAPAAAGTGTDRLR